MKVRTEININFIAAKLAQSEDTEQAKFLDIFFTELMHTCETQHHTKMQLHSIKNKMRDKSIECMKTLVYEDENEM